VNSWPRKIRIWIRIDDGGGASWTECGVDMDFWSETNWFAVQTKPQRESLAVASVPDDRIRRFFPRCMASNAPGPGSMKPLFPGYFFARFCPAVDLDRVRYARGVLRVLSASGIPLPVEDETIQEILDRLDPDGCVHLRPPALRPGEYVCIEEGPLRGLIGRVECEWDDGRRVAILLDALLHSRVIVNRVWLSSAAVG
jgi:transcriptional antiterminator RfaH